MKVTKQDKRDIDKTILYLNEVAEYIDMLKGCRDGTPSWKPSVIDDCDVAVESLERIKKEGNKQDKLKYDKEDYSYEFELDQKKTDHKTDHRTDYNENVYKNITVRKCKKRRYRSDKCWNETHQEYDKDTSEKNKKLNADNRKLNENAIRLNEENTKTND